MAATGEGPYKVLVKLCVWPLVIVPSEELMGDSSWGLWGLAEGTEGQFPPGPNWAAIDFHIWALTYVQTI